MTVNFSSVILTCIAETVYPLLQNTIYQITSLRFISDRNISHWSISSNTSIDPSGWIPKCDEVCREKWVWNEVFDDWPQNQCWQSLVRCPIFAIDSHLLCIKWYIFSYHSHIHLMLTEFSYSPGKNNISGRYTLRKKSQTNMSFTAMQMLTWAPDIDCDVDMTSFFLPKQFSARAYLLRWVECTFSAYIKITIARKEFTWTTLWCSWLMVSHILTYYN